MESLTREKASLMQQNEVLSQDKERLSQSLNEMVRSLLAPTPAGGHRIISSNLQLNVKEEERKTLMQQNEALSVQNKSLRKVRFAPLLVHDFRSTACDCSFHAHRRWKSLRCTRRPRGNCR